MTSKTAFVTGATSGFGRAIATRLLREGWQVVATGRRAERLQALKDEAGDALHAACFDMRDADAVTAAIDALPPAFGRINLLVNNAGQGRVSTFAETTDEAWREELELKFQKDYS